MTFNKGDKLQMLVDGRYWVYVVQGESKHYGSDMIEVIDDEGDNVLLNKGNVTKRIGISWEYIPVTVNNLPEELFHV